LDDAIETDEYMRNRVSSKMCSMKGCAFAVDLSFTIHLCVHLALSILRLVYSLFEGTCLAIYRLEV